jgi:hypothetical protein
MSKTKNIGDLELVDFDRFPIWKSALDLPDGCDNEMVRPVAGKSIVADGDSNLWVRVVGKLADGTDIAGIAFAELPPPSLSNWSFFIEGKWLVLLLPPAPDFVLAKSGPRVFAESLGRDLHKVFPIRLKSEVVFENTGQELHVTIEP